jgi:hypothetical protein
MIAGISIRVKNNDMNGTMGVIVERAAIVRDTSQLKSRLP